MGTIKPVIGFSIVYLFVLVSCISTDEKEGKGGATAQDQQMLIDTAGETLFKRFKPPLGFARTILDSSSFGYYLRHLKLKTFGTRVRYYDGRIKNQNNIYISVVDMDIGNRDLQQCADAVMRLRSEFLYARKRYQDIHFNFISDGIPRYYEDYIEGDYSYEKFREYLDYIFDHANTRSLSQELNPVTSIHEIKIGDVFIQTRNPYGHAVIVVDMAQNPDTGEKVYMLVQGYMPAQDFQVLVNRKNQNNSPWYLLGEGPIETPEWTFDPVDLKRFED